MRSRLWMSVALAAVAAGSPAPAAGAAPVLPDLVADPPANPRIVEETDVARGPAGRLLLRFDAFVHNAGAGPLQITGAERVGLTMGSVMQDLRAPDGDGWAWTRRPAPAAVQYETTDGHSHWHLKEIARYSLVDPTGAATVAPVQKTGFCLEDSERISGSAPAHYGPDGGPDGVPWTSCHRFDQAPASVAMGISPGWRDLYPSRLYFQWVDVSGVAPGPYRLRAEVDTIDAVEESDEDNLPGDLLVVVPGHTASPQTVAGTGGAPLDLTLASVAHKSAGQTLGSAAYAVERLPAHGQLLDAAGEAVVAGQRLASPRLRYVPRAGAPPTDDFEFSARDAGSRFPLSAPRAAVALQAGTSPRQVTLSGAQDVYAGASLQLTAAVSGATAGELTWEATSGEVDASGLYRAPAGIPEGGRATVTATLPTGERGQVTFAIVPEPERRPAPTPPPSAAMPLATPTGVLPPAVRRPRTRGPGTAPVPGLRLQAVVAGPSISASVLSRFTGRLRVRLLAGSRTISSCTNPARARRTYLCLLPTRGRSVASLRVVATLRRANGRLLRRTVRPGAKRARAAAAGHRHRHP